MSLRSTVNTVMTTMLALFAAQASASNCNKLAALQLEHVTITKAEDVTSGVFTPPHGPPITGLPSFCRVAATLKATADSEILVEIWMPESGWNERIEGTGNGGLAGEIAYAGLSKGVRLGYAVANTDMGMKTPVGETASIFVNRPERWADWGYRATHQMTVLAKQVVAAYYARDAKKSYFVGCSTGGQQALMEAQRFPDDYDGIVGGAPANNRTGVHVSILWNFAVPQRTPTSYLSQEKIAMLAKAVLDRCDLLDGVKDGLISDPPKCNFDPELLACKNGDRGDCLTLPQVETVRALYSGPVDPRTGKSIYPGLAMGSEAGWGSLSQPPAPKSTAPFAPVFQWVFGRDWDWRTFDFDHDVDALNRQLANSLNATNPNIDIFRSKGHKLLEYQGWADPLVVPGETIRYYQTVVALDGEKGSNVRHRSTSSGSSRGSLDSSYRLFMIPGMKHCSAGGGASDFDALGTVVRWVELGIAPDSIVASRTPVAQGQETSAVHRLLCPYPRIAQYDGQGNIDDTSSYTCVLPIATPQRDH